MADPIIHGPTTASETPRPELQSGLLDLDVELSSPQLYSGAEFALYLRIRNPFNRPVWIHDVTTSLPRQMYCRGGAQSTTEAFPRRQRLGIERLSAEAERIAQEVSSLESE